MQAQIAVAHVPPPPAPQQHPSQSSPRSASFNHADHGDSDDGQHSGDDDNIDVDGPHESGRLGKRKRPISVSCELCKQRKVKCDRGQPSCGWCSRNNALCEYKERKKPGLRAGYGRELEQRLDRLEEILRTHSEILQTSSFVSDASPTSGHTAAIQLNTAPSIKGSNASLPSDHGTPRDAVAPQLFPRAGPDSIRTPQAETALFLQKPSTSIDFGILPPTTGLMNGFTPMGDIASQSSMTPAVPTSAAAQEYYSTRPTAHTPLSTTTSMGPSQSQISSDQELPPYDLLYALVDLYFKHINTWCPILHRKSTLDSLFGPSTIEETDKILLHAIVATTLRFSTDLRLTEERRKHYHDVSKQRVLLYGMENSSVKALQALVILALDLCGSSHGPPGWNIMALITRSVVQLGLAVETYSFLVSPSYTSIYTLRAMVLPEPRDFIEDESRRRLFWMVYLLDRYATISTAFDFALDDKEIDRTLPCRDDLWMKNQKVETRWFNTDHCGPHNPGGSINGTAPEYETNKPENLGTFSYYIEILGILSQIHKFLKQPVDISALSDVEAWQMRFRELDHMLTTWKFNLPGEYGNLAKLFQPNSAKSINCGWVMLHATFHTAVMRLHSSAAYPTTRSPIFTPSYSASQRCHTAVESIAALAEFVVNNGLLARLGPPFAFTLWVAARLLLVHGSTVEHKLSPQIDSFVETLREMGRYWPIATRYSTLLQRVLDEHRDSERAGNGDTKLPASVKILADMRRTAFDLDLLISRQPLLRVRHATPSCAAIGATAATGVVGSVAGAGAGAGGNGIVGGGGTGGAGGSSGGGGAGGGGSGSGGWHSRFASVTPARTPQPNELEYLDVFDFFNVPRLQFGSSGGGGASNGVDGTGGGDGLTNGNGGGDSGIGGTDGGANTTTAAPVAGNGTGGRDGSNGAGGVPGEFNITEFMVDANRDWFKPEGAKFVA